MHNINTFLFQLVHQGAGYWPVLDWFFIILTSYSTYIVIVLTVLWFVGFTPFRTNDMNERMKRFGQGGQMLLSLFLTWAVVWIIKVLVAHPRPFISIPDITPLVSAAPFESFPSAHAAFAMTIAIAVLPYHKRLGQLLVAFAFIVGLSRLYVGVHYPFDVAIGLLIGFLIPKALYRVFKKEKKIAD